MRRSRSSFSTQSRRSARRRRSRSHAADRRRRRRVARRGYPGLSLTSIDAGRGLRSSSRTRRGTPPARAARAPARSPPMTYVGGRHLGERLDVLPRRVTRLDGRAGQHVRHDLRPVPRRRAAPGCRLSATRPNSPTAKSENAIVVTESADSSGARRKARSASRMVSVMPAAPRRRRPARLDRPSRTRARRPAAR